MHCTEIRNQGKSITDRMEMGKIKNGKPRLMLTYLYAGVHPKSGLDQISDAGARPVREYLDPK